MSCVNCGGMALEEFDEQPIHSGVYPCLCDVCIDDPDAPYELLKERLSQNEVEINLYDTKS
jgi:hypothetical protein